MIKTFKIKKGLDIALYGQADTKNLLSYQPTHIALKPDDFIGLLPKLVKEVGDKINAGEVVFYDKHRPEIKITSPVNGELIEIKRGEKRKIEELIIKVDTSITNNASHIDIIPPKQELIEKLQENGLWNFIRQRPYEIIADPKQEPKALFITCMDSAPLAPDYNFIIAQEEKAFLKGLDIVNTLLNGKTYLNFNAKAEVSDKIIAKDVVVSKFKGPHPSGNVGVHINYLNPINKGEIVWYLDAQDVINIGNWAISGEYKPMRTVVVTGAELKDPKYIKTNIGAAVEPLFKDNVKIDNIRYISGTVFTGTKIENNGYISYFDNQLTVLEEGDYYDLFGWVLPKFKKYSVSKSYFSWLNPKKKRKLSTNTNGEDRNFVVTGLYEKYLPLNVMPMQLLKAISIKDVELMEELGIYEVSPEDFAICEFVCPSKTEIQELVRGGLELIRKEMS